MSEEWGPWIEHDGKAWPMHGLVAEKEYANGLILIGVIGSRALSYSELGVPFYSGKTFQSSWVWDAPGPFVPVIRYRIRKPKGMTILEGILADLPAPVPPPRVDA